MTATKYFIIIALCAIIGFDTFELIRDGYHATISWVLYSGSKDYPIISFAVGVVMGHLFWPHAHDS